MAMPVAILTGAGTAHFAFADVKELTARGQSAEPPPPFVSLDMEPSMESGFDVQPTIAAINGYCIGIGLTIAIPATSGSRRARTLCWHRGAPRHPDDVGAIRTSWVTGMQTALDMLLTGDIFDIEYAQRRGFVNSVVPRSTDGGGGGSPGALSERSAGDARHQEVLVRGQRMPFSEAWLGEALRPRPRERAYARRPARCEKRPAMFKGW
jgi:enoyl-CoA hydratase/carnithine racemase